MSPSKIPPALKELINQTPEKFRMSAGLGFPLNDDHALKRFDCGIRVPSSKDGAGYQHAIDNLNRFVSTYIIFETQLFLPVFHQHALFFTALATS